MFTYLVLSDSESGHATVSCVQLSDSDSGHATVSWVQLLSPKSRFAPRAVHVEFLVDKVEL
jgi:hypothetical protein